MMEFLTFQGIFMTARTLCLCSCALPSEMLSKLRERYHVIPLPPDVSLDEPVQSHPDMLCAVLDDAVFFPRKYAEAYPALLREIAAHTSRKLLFTDAPRSSRYPEDVGLNAAVLPGALLCRADSTAPELLRYAQAGGRKIISVRQGYAACSCIFCGSDVLTSDVGICRVLRAHGIACDHVSNRGILLPGYDVGFIGGCGGVHGSMFYLFGTHDSVAGSAEICNFADRHALTLSRLSPSPLTDYGGLKFL